MKDEDLAGARIANIGITQIVNSHTMTTFGSSDSGDYSGAASRRDSNDGHGGAFRTGQICVM